MNVKRLLLVGATVTTVSLGGIGDVGLVSAATDDSSSSGSSLIDKLASKFNLNKDEVQAVFDEDREARDAERAADQKEKLAEAVTSGKLTQAQADYITKAVAEIDTLRGTGTPDSEDDTIREKIKDKMDALKDWADDNDIDMQYIMMGGHGGHGGGMREKSDSSTSS